VKETIQNLHIQDEVGPVPYMFKLKSYNPYI